MMLTGKNQQGLVRLGFRAFATTTILAAAFSANAALEQIRFDDAAGEEKTAKLVEGQHEYLNVASQATIAISAGLDRKLAVSILLDGQVIHTEKTTVITVDDVITAQGKSFYGKSVDLPVHDDGDYEISIQTLSLLDDVVNTESYKFVKDTEAPTMGSIRLSSYGGSSNNLTPADVWYTGYYSSNFVEMADIEDGSGISQVHLISYELETGEPVFYKKRLLEFDSEKRLARFTFHQDSGMWPRSDNGDTLYGVAYEVTDNAGNTSVSKVQPMYYDSVGAVGLELIGVRNPNSTNEIAGLVGYDPYVSGAEVNENPISFIYRIPKSEHMYYRRGGYSAVGHSKLITDHDDEYVYAVFERSYGFTNSNYVGFRDQRSWRVANVSYNLKLGEGVPKAPARVGKAEYLYSDRGWSSWYRRGIKVDELPIKILASRQRVEPRDYVQVWNHHGMTCRVEPGEEICEAYLPTPWELVDGSSAYYHGSSSINSEDNKLVGPPGWADVTYNAQHAPEIKSFDLSEDFVLTANVFQPLAGSWFDTLRLADVYLIDGNGTRLPINRSLTRAGVDYEATWDLSQLPEGSYDISIVAVENHGLKTTEQSAVSFDNDTTKPSISVGYDGNQGVPDTINNLRKLEIELVDNFSEVFIESIELKTRDSELDVRLGYSLLEASEDLTTKLYAPELPRLFPTLIEGKIYDILIRVRDSYGNVTTESLSFSYMPENLVVMTTQRGLSTATALLRPDNEALNYLESNIELKLDDGRMATGYQEAILTLEPTSDFPIEVLGQTLNPGESQNVTIDLGVSGGRLNIPLVPLSAGVEGKTNLMFEIPSLATIYNDSDGWQKIYDLAGGCSSETGCSTKIPYGDFTETQLTKVIPSSMKCADGTLPNSSNECPGTSSSVVEYCSEGSVKPSNGQCIVQSEFTHAKKSGAQIVPRFTTEMLVR